MILQDLGLHKSAAVRQAIWAEGARFLFPPQILVGCEPDRAALRQKQAQPAQAAKRSFGAVSDAIATVLETVTPTEYSNYLTHAGYDLG